jgi:hypothetical protein
MNKILEKINNIMLLILGHNPKDPEWRIKLIR